MAEWPGAERRDPPRTSPTWVVRRALAGWLQEQAAELRGGPPVRILDVGCGVKPYYPFFADVASGRQHAQSGSLRALGVTAPARLPTLPDVPAIAEVVPGYEANGWYGFAAPKGTPRDVIEKLNAAINAGLNDGDLKARFAQLEAAPLVFTPKEYGAFLVSESERWGKAVKASGVKGD